MSGLQRESQNNIAITEAQDRNTPNNNKFKETTVKLLKGNGHTVQDSFRDSTLNCMKICM